MAILTHPQTNSLTTLETGALAECIATRACRRFLHTTHSCIQRLQKPSAATNPDSLNSDFLSLLTTPEGAVPRGLARPKSAAVPKRSVSDKNICSRARLAKAYVLPSKISIFCLRHTETQLTRSNKQIPLKQTNPAPNTARGHSWSYVQYYVHQRPPTTLSTF